MRTRADIVSGARRFIGTAFHHQGRLLGVGVDCIGLCWGAYVFAGFETPTPPHDYPRVAVDMRLHEELERFLVRIEPGEVRDGDLEAFAFVAGVPQHVSIVSTLRGARSMVHCWSGSDRVSEHALTRSWINRRVSAWRMPGIQEGAAWQPSPS